MTLARPRYSVSALSGASEHAKSSMHPLLGNVPSSLHVQYDNKSSKRPPILCILWFEMLAQFKSGTVDIPLYLKFLECFSILSDKINLGFHSIFNII